ncbi:hypothetical protein HDU67_007123 [Dinochytrium kinnereticum]|nr:hypothetical protein HDU67_007123 [Dinochytrium kinnereticum]
MEAQLVKHKKVPVKRKKKQAENATESATVSSSQSPEVDSLSLKSPVSEEEAPLPTINTSIIARESEQTSDQFDVSNLSLGTNVLGPVETMYSTALLENELAEAMATPQPLDYPELLPMVSHSNGIDFGWDVHSFVPRQLTYPVEPTAPPALVWEEDLNDVEGHFDGLKIEEELMSPLVIIEGLPEELLSAVYVNTQLATHAHLVEEFRGTSSNFPMGDIFFDRVKEYEQALRESSRSKVRLQVLLSTASSLAIKVWTLRKISSHAEDRCLDSIKVRHIFNSEVSVLNEAELSELDAVLASIRHETFSQSKTNLFKGKLIRLWIQNHIDEFLSSIASEEAEARFKKKMSLEVADSDALKHFIDILFFFERKSFYRTTEEENGKDAADVCATPFVKDVRGWITHLLSAFLSRASLEDQRYILLHYLRTEGIGRWGASFIQWPLPRPWTEIYLSHYLTVLHAVLSPIEEIEQALKVKEFEIAQIRDSLKLLEDLDWIVIDEDDIEEELSPLKATILDEDDYLALLDQLNTMPIFISYLQEALSGQIHMFSVDTNIDNLFLHIFAVTNHIQNSLSRGLSLFSSKHYPFMIKRVAQLATDVSRSLGDFLNSNMSIWGAVKSSTDLNLQLATGVDEMMQTSIQAELDSCFLRTVKMLLSNPRKGVWPFLSDLRLEFVSRASKWKLICQIILSKSATASQRLSLEELLARFDEEWSAETGIFAVFEANTNEIIHLLTFFANLVIDDIFAVPLASMGTPPSQDSARKQDGFLDLAVAVSRVIFIVSYTSSYHKDTLAKPARDLLRLVCESQKAVMSYLLTWTRDRFSDLGSTAIYLFSELPVASWQPNYGDFVIIQSMLRDPISSAKFRLAKYIVNHLNWSMTENGVDLFIPRPYHRLVALAITNIYLDRQSLRESRSVIGATTAYASTAISTVGNIALTGSLSGSGEKDLDFNEWCWAIIMRLNLYQRPQSFDIYALEAFQDGTRPYESLESSTIATLRGAMKTNALAAYSVVMISEMGYNFNLFEKEGWSLLQLLAEGGFVKATLKVIVEVMFSFAKTHGIGVLNNSKFSNFFSSFYRNRFRLGPLKTNYKSDVVSDEKNTDFEILKICLSDITSSYLPQSDRELILIVLLKTVFSDPEWMGYRSSVRLVDILVEISIALGRPALIQTELGREYSRLIALYTSNQNSSARFSILHPVESVKSLASTIGDMYYGYPSLLVGSDRFSKESLWNRVGVERECFWLAYMSLVVEISAEFEERQHVGNAIVRDPLSSLSSLSKESSKPLNSYAIYRCTYQILDTPDTHPTMPLLLQLFFSLYFERSKEVLNSSFSCFGYRFFHEKKDVLDRLERKLDSLVKMQIDENGTSGDLHRLFNAMSLWLREKRLTTNDVYVDHLAAPFYIVRLREILSGRVTANAQSAAWFDLLPMRAIELRMRTLTGIQSPGSRRSSVSNNRLTSMDKHLRSVSPALPPPVFSLRSPSVTRLSDYSLKVGNDVMKTSIPFIMSKAHRFLEIMEEQKKCDSSYIDSMKSLYVNENKRGRIEKKCSSSCNGAAVISFKYSEVKLLLEVKNILKENRVASDSFSSWDNMDPQVCVSTLRLLRMIDWICSEVHDDSEGVEAFALQVFYEILGEFSNDINRYPPVEAVLEDIVMRLGSLFIANSEKETVKIFGLRSQKNALLLSKIFNPAITASEFTSMYLAMQRNFNAADKSLTVLFLRRFNVVKWLEAFGSDEMSLDFLRAVLECMHMALSTETPDDDIVLIHRDAFRNFCSYIRQSSTLVAAIEIILRDVITTSIPVFVINDLISSLAPNFDFSANVLEKGEVFDWSLDREVLVSSLKCCSAVFNEVRTSLECGIVGIGADKCRALAYLLSLFFTSQTLYSMQSDVSRDELMTLFQRIWLPLVGLNWSLSKDTLEITLWREEDKDIAQFLIETLCLMLGKVCRHSSSQSAMGHYIWDIYYRFVELNCPSYVLDLIQRVFLKLVKWENFSVTTKMVEDLWTWTSGEGEYPLALSVQRFACGVLTEARWVLDISTLHSDSSFAMKSLLLMFSLLQRSQFIHPNDEDRAVFLLYVWNQVLSWGATNISPECYVRIIHVLPMKWKTNAETSVSTGSVTKNPLSLTLDLLRNLSGVEALCNGSLISDLQLSHTFAKLEFYNDYVFDLISLQTAIPRESPKSSDPSSIPRSFATDRIGSIVVETVNLVSDISNEIEEKKLQLLNSTIERIYMILNTCSKSSREYPLIWGGVREAISSSEHSSQWLAAACRSIASAEYMALTAELCIERELLHSRDSSRWVNIRQTLVVPELEAESFIRHCLSHALVLTLYAQALQKLDEFNGNSDLKIMIGEQLGIWIAGLKMEAVEEGKEGKVLLLFLKFSELLQDELSALPLPEHHSRLRAHLPAMADSLLRWGQDRANQGLWATLGFGPKSRLSAEFRFFSRAAGAFLATRLIGANGGRKEEEQKLRLIEAVSSVSQSREFENSWCQVEDVVQFLRDENEKGLAAFQEFLIMASRFTMYSAFYIATP